MERGQIIDALLCLNENNPLECDGDIIQLLESNISNLNAKLNIRLDDVVAQTSAEITKFNPDDTSPIWNYLLYNIHFLTALKTSLKSSPPEDVLSVQQSNLLKKILQQFTGIGIRCNLLNSLPQYINHKSQSFRNEGDLILRQYNRLAACTYFLIECVKCKKLRAVVVQANFQAVLNGLYQIVYCPLKKPTAEEGGKFKMTPELHARFTQEKLTFKACLDYCGKSIHKTVYCKESMLLMGVKTPLWFQKAVSANLTKIMQSEKGVESITLALMDNAGDYDRNDSTKTWKVFEVLIKLVMSLNNTPDFHSNICTQIENLIATENAVFEQLFIACVKVFYIESMDVFNRLLKNVLDPLTQLTLLNHSADITDSINQSVRLLHSIFIVTSVNYPEIHIKIIEPYTAILFRLFSATITSNLCDLNHHISQILIKYISAFKHRNVEIYDALLFNKYKTATLVVKRKLLIHVKNERIRAVFRDDNLRVNMNQIGDDLIKLLRNNSDLLMDFFVYLLHCLSNKDVYFKTERNKDLLRIEQEFVLDVGIERNLLVYNLLSNLSDNKTIQTQINADPSGVVDYIHGVIKKALDDNVHMTKEVESDAFQSVFVTIMILQALVGNCDNRENYAKLLQPLKCILTQCLSEELRALVGEIVQLLEKGAFKNGARRTKEVTDLDKAIEDVCDPLLPIRGHGLMVLATLVQKKDKHAMERKLFILNIFQQNLKNEDSYIYLSSIKGLAAMADVFPDTVLKIVTEEYSDFTRKDVENSNELRMKIGEVLVRVTRMLGDTATKYKSLLLNTFLNGTKDGDHLIRASSLSNLGEICRVLGYKLGAIVIEVLVCVHAVITTDKAVEARRAAVTVIRQLFAGLESEMIAYLKDDILEIYRSLKNIYQNDRDDVMRLQAQLALEELNENMKQFVLPKPELSFEKKIVVMKDTHF